MTTLGRPLLQTKGLAKSFGATRALVDGTLRVDAGQVHVLLGENGAGKSTLAKIIAGVVRPDNGSIHLDGARADIADARSARRHGIGMVFQELSLAPHLSIQDNLFLGAEGRGAFRLVERQSERRQAEEMLDRLRLPLSPSEPVAKLSIAQKQLLEIAKILLRRPRLIIMDEPTSRLSRPERVFLFETILRLREEGVGFLYVTHHLREIFEIGDEVSIMRAGAIVDARKVDGSISEARLLELLTGRNLSAEVQRPRGSRDEQLVVWNLTVDGRCRDVSLRVRRSEIVGLYGMIGCGREAVGRALVGLEPVSQGEIQVGGLRYRVRTPGHALSRGVGYVPGDRKDAGILPHRPVRENLLISSMTSVSRAGIIRRARERERAEELLARLQVHYSSIDQTIASLSGGNQQKVLLGRLIAGRPRVLVLDDPTAGIDIGAKLEIYRLLKKVAEEGTSLLLLSSDLPETLLLCNRIYTMYGGRIVREHADASLADEEAVLADVLGHQGAHQRAAAEGRGATHD